MKMVLTVKMYLDEEPQGVATYWIIRRARDQKRIAQEASLDLSTMRQHHSRSPNVLSL